ncbi:MAG: hypothetical protein U5K75_08130 [Ahrensia sp.]|nr:hypothetical protein [Ahrensia sp.]
MEKFSQKILLLNGWRRFGVAVVSGAATSFMVAPFHLFFIAFLTFPVLVWLLDGATGQSNARRLGRLMPAFWIGWAFGFGYFVGGLWWIANALLVEAPEFAWAIPLAVLGLPAFLAIFYGFACLLARAIWSDSLARIFVLAAAFGFAEWLRSFVVTGFPWNAVAYGIMPTPIMMQSVAFTGFDAMNVLAVLVFALPSVMLTAGRRRNGAVLLLVGLMSVHLGLGYWRLNIVPEPTPDGRIIRVVQPSVDQSEKWRPELAKENFDLLLALSSAEPIGESTARPQLIVLAGNCRALYFNARARRGCCYRGHAANWTKPYRRCCSRRAITRRQF